MRSSDVAAAGMRSAVSGPPPPAPPAAPPGGAAARREPVENVTVPSRSITKARLGNAANAFSTSPSMPSSAASYGMESRFWQRAAFPARSSRLCASGARSCRAARSAAGASTRRWGAPRGCTTSRKVTLRPYLSWSSFRSGTPCRNCGQVRLPKARAAPASRATTRAAACRRRAGARRHVRRLRRPRAASRSSGRGRRAGIVQAGHESSRHLRPGVQPHRTRSAWGRASSSCRRFAGMPARV